MLEVRSRLSLDEAALARRREARRTPEHKASAAAYQRHRRKMHPEIVRKNNLRQFHGLSLAEYEAIAESQAGVCAVCGRGETGRNQYGVLPLAVDHDHATGATRGLLCMRCNRALGLLRDDPQVIERLLIYRRKN